MEVQHVPGGEPPKARTRKPKTRDPAVNISQASQGAHGQQPPSRKSNRAAQQQQEVANWDGYANADPAQAYTEHYGYGDEQYVDAHGYDYGGAQAEAGQGYGYGDAGQGYGYGGAQGDGQEYGYVAAPTQHTVKEKSKKTRKPKPVADGVYQGGYENQHHGDEYGQPVQGSYEESYGSQHGSQHQVDAYGQPVQDGYAYPEAYNAAPEPMPHKRDCSKSRKPSRVKLIEKGNHGDGVYVDPGAGAYAAQHGEPSYGVNYDNGMVPGAGVNPKGRKKNTDKQFKDIPVPTEETPHDAAGAESALTSRAISRVRGEHDGDGSARSRASQENSSSPGRPKSSDLDGSGSNRSKPHRDGSGSGSGRVRPENDTRSTPSGTPRLNPAARDPSNSHLKPDHRDGSGRRSKEKLETVKAPEAIQANPLNEHLRKTGGGKPKPTYNDMSMMVFHDPNDRTLIMNIPEVSPKAAPAPAPAPAPARPSLDEWMKKQSDRSAGNNFVNQDVSMIVGVPDDLDREVLETQMFRAPLKKKQPIKLPPVVETVDRPQYQPRADNGRNNNQYQPVPAQRRPYPNSPNPQDVAKGSDMKEDAAEGKQVQPNAKCMACVHGIGVPIARVATRIACRQCLTCGCTIL